MYKRLMQNGESSNVTVEFRSRTTERRVPTNRSVAFYNYSYWRKAPENLSKSTDAIEKVR